MKKNSSEILGASWVRFSMNFICKDKLDSLAKELTKVLEVKVVSIEDKDMMDYYKFNTSNSLFLLENDVVSGEDSKSLTTGFIYYKGACEFIFKMFNWMKDNVATQPENSMSFDVAFDHTKIKVNPISGLNKLKFALNFNEDFIWKKYEERKKKFDRRQLRDIRPNSIFITGAREDNQFKVAPNLFYSADLSKIDKGYVSFNYIGGSDYHLKKSEAIDTINYSILNLYSALEMSFNDVDYKKINNIIDKNNKYLQAFKDPDLFNKFLPDIKFTIDLIDDPTVRKSRWSQLKNELFRILVECDAKEMHINYDSDLGKFQIKDTKFDKVEISNVTLVNCYGSGIFVDCDIYNCSLENSFFTDCELKQETIVKYSTVHDTDANKTCSMDKCRIINKFERVVDCSLIDCIWVEGKKGHHTDMNKGCRVISSIEADIKKEPKNYGVYAVPDEKQFVNVNIAKYM